MATPLQELERELFGLLKDARTTNSLAVAGLTIVVYASGVQVTQECSPSVDLSCGFISLDLVQWSSDDYELITMAQQLPAFFLRFGYYMGDLEDYSTSWFLSFPSTCMLGIALPLLIEPSVLIVRKAYFGGMLLIEYAIIPEVPRLFTFYAIPPFVTVQYAYFRLKMLVSDFVSMTKAFLMFSMTLYKCGATLVALGPRRTPVITLFFRDGVFWFLALVLVSIIEIVLWDKARPTLAQIPVVLIAVIGARVILNIKYVASNGDSDMDAGTTERDLHRIPARRAATRVPWYLKTDDTSIYEADTIPDHEHCDKVDSAELPTAIVSHCT
ncbi:hypothetical protein DFH09DRAFT_1082926 [Mycena vulgaris]|nr:hypothetical protein DFH09DRAFT_1082926 [Mycena vulgaris]